MEIGGTNLDPFYALLPGGKTGSFIKDMLHLFIYNQISPRNDDLDDEAIISDEMDIQDLPNFMRCIGYYMTDFEEQLLMKEVLDSGKEKLTFEDVVILFLNHRTILQAKKEDVEQAICDTMQQSLKDDDDFDITTLIQKLSETGETAPIPDLNFYFGRLLKNDEELVDSEDAVCDEEIRGITFENLVDNLS